MGQDDKGEYFSIRTEYCQIQTDRGDEDGAGGDDDDDNDDEEEEEKEEDGDDDDR